MFVWRVDVILDAIKTYQLSMYQKLMEIDAAIGTASEADAISYAFSQIESVSVDYGVIEKGKRGAGNSCGYWLE